MKVTITAIVFSVLLGAAGLCVMFAALAVFFAMPGAAFPPPNSAALLFAAAAALVGTGFAASRLLTGAWFPLVAPEQQDADDLTSNDEEIEDEEEELEESELRNDRGPRQDVDRLLPF